MTEMNFFYNDLSTVLVLQHQQNGWCMMDGMKERNPQAQFTGKFISKPAQDIIIIAFKAIICLALFHIMAS
jgi:hypothetical protein